MTPGPVQITLLILSVTLCVALWAALFRRAVLAYIRWYAAFGVGVCLAQIVLGLAVLPHEGGGGWTGAYLSIELAGASAWLFFSKRFARHLEGELDTGPRWSVVIVSGIVFGGITASSDYLTLPPGGLTSVPVYNLTTMGFIVRVFSLGVLILSLTNLEDTLVNSVHGQRWRIKFTILGVFSIVAAQVFTISLGLLYRAIDVSLILAVQTGFILGTGFMLYSVLFRGGETPVTVSKRLARTSVVLFGAGAYLLFLGTLGLVLGLTGYSGSRALLLALGLITGVAILTFLLSEGFRRRFNRILQVYFYKEKYDYRIQWLSFTRRLSRVGSRGKLHRAVLLGFCETFGMGGGVLYLKDPDGQRMLPVQTCEIAQPPPLENWKVILSTVDAGLAAADIRGIKEGVDPKSMAFFQEAGAAFVVPLMRDDCLDGIILLTNPIDPSEEYNQEDFDLMEALATQAYSSMLNYRLTDELAKVRDMEVMGKVSAFVVHDLKNLVYALSLILDNAKRYIQNPEFQHDLLKGLENTVSKMHYLISQLRQLPSRENLNLEPVDLMQLSRDTFKHLPLRGLVFRGDSAPAMADRAQMQKVVLNLILNAREASEEDDPVVIEAGLGKAPYLRIIDSGCGMSPEFLREGLFQPFRTTKTKGMGIGLYQCKQIVEAHGGTIEVESSEGGGAVFTVRLPSIDVSGPLEVV